MERDIDAAKTYAAIRRLERQAEAIKVLYREYREVGQDAERVMLIAKHRIGEELKAAPINNGLLKQGPRRAQSDAATPPTMAEQVGSQDRGHRLKKLAEMTRDELLGAASKLWEAGKEATQSAVLKLIAGVRAMFSPSR